MNRHPSIDHYLRCKNSHVAGNSINIDDDYDYKPTISTFMSALVSLKNEEIEQKNECKFVENGYLLFKYTNEFEKIENDIDKLCRIVYSNLDTLQTEFLKYSDEFETNYSIECSILDKFHLKEIVVELLSKHLKCDRNGLNTGYFSYLSFAVVSSLIEKIIQLILYNVSRDIFEHPPTFSEMLMNEKLSEIFPKQFLNFMRITLAHPGGLNLRNLLWHGFISHSHDFDDRYTSLLFLVLVTILKFSNVFLLKEENHETIRKWIEGSRISKHYKKIRSIYNFQKRTSLDSETRIIEISKNSYLITPDRRNLVNSSIHEYFSNSKNGKIFFLYLIIPQIEHFLRRIFVICNDLDQNLLLAKSRELFTIVDDILGFGIDQKTEEAEEEESKKVVSNVIWKELGVSNQQKCLDFLFFPGGFRIRDVIAHSEIHVDKDIDLLNYLAELLMELFVELLKKFDIREKFIEKDIQLSYYTLKFHPKSQFLIELNNVNLDLLNFRKKMEEVINVEFWDMLQNIKEVVEYECIWNRKLFFYRKKKNVKKQNPKLKEFGIDEVLIFLKNFRFDCEKSSKFKEIIIGLLSSTGSGRSNIIEYFVDIVSKNSDFPEYCVIEDYKNPPVLRKKILNNIGIGRKTLEESKLLFSSILGRSESLLNLSKNRKARTSHRKNLGTLVQCWKLFDVIIEILLFQTLNFLLSSFFLRDGKVEKKHEYLHRELSKIYNWVNRIRLDVEEGKFGFILKEIIFLFFRIGQKKKK